MVCPLVVDSVVGLVPVLANLNPSLRTVVAVWLRGSEVERLIGTFFRAEEKISRTITGRL